MSLPLKFYQRDTTKVARELLGKRLVHMLPNGERRDGIIVETEAYLGIEDAACHTWKSRRTDRVRSMYLEGGHAYVYMIYGMYYCFNVVTRNADEPEAVLIRALEPGRGFAWDQVRATHQGRIPKKYNELNGPGKLCRGLGINRKDDGERLDGSRIYIEESDWAPVKPKDIIARPRVGVDYAGEAATWPLRFYINGSPFISKA
jgi:DNA-3-methyladenine glycosylase